MTKISGQQFVDARLDGWILLADGLHTRIRTGDFATGLALVNAIGAAAEAANHHPDLDLRYSHVDIRLVSHDVQGVTSRDLKLARSIVDLATAGGLTPDAGGLSRLELGLDSPAAEKVRPFWAAVLGLQPDGDALADPSGRLPAIWFQESGGEEPRQRWHPDLWIDPADVQPRIAAAIAAGGSLVTDEYAPRFWVLADAEGNRICLCTWQGRASYGAQQN